MKKRKKISKLWLYCCLLAIPIIALVFIPHMAYSQPSTAPLYGVWEMQVSNSKSYSNPYDLNAIDLRAVFIAPSGKKVNFLGFP